MGMEDFWEQLPTGKEDKPLLFEMGPLEYDFHDIDGLYFMLDRRLSGCLLMMWAKPMNPDIQGTVTLDSRVVSGCINQYMEVMGNMWVLGIPLRGLVTEYGREYQLHVEGFVDMDGNEMNPQDFTVRGVEKVKPKPEDAAHEQIALEAAREGIVLLKNEAEVLPLKKGTVLNLFGRGIHEFRIGAVGAGKINPRYSVNFVEAVREGEAYSLNEELVEFYGCDRDEIPEDEMLMRAKKLSDTAIVFLTRAAGENQDASTAKGEYYLSEAEEALIAKVTDTFAKTIVVLNVGYPIDVTFAEKYAVAGLIYSGFGGMLAGPALSDILSGAVNPSGKLPDTWAKDYFDIPSSKNFYDCVDKTRLTADENIYVDTCYEEDIYVGYRYFTTFRKKVAYPFGYGLSYTEFCIRQENIRFDGEVLELDVYVKNVGEKAGKEVVQVYYSAPDGIMEKPTQELAGFAKTKLLAPGEKDVVTITFATTDMASFDAYDAAWIMEEGEYTIRVGNSSRNTEAVAVIDLDEQVTTLQLKRLMRDTIAVRELHHMIPIFDIEFDFGVPAIPFRIMLQAENFKKELVEYEVMRRTLMDKRKDEVLTLEDVKAGNATLDELTAQLTVEEMAELCVGTERRNGDGNVIGSASSCVPGAAGDTTSSLLETRKVPNLIQADGPAGLRLETPCTAIPIATTLAQSWDMDLIHRMGELVGEEMKQLHVDLWLAPGMNIHRNPLCGRNFEYYSEDPVLTGLCAATETKGVQSQKGKGTTIKHFAGNNQEDNRMFTNAHISERALREIYLKGFEIAVKTAQPYAIMTSYNLINGTHAANHYDMLQNVARDEWGFEGFIMTDWYTSQDTTALGMVSESGKYSYSDGVQCIKAGNDLQMPGCRKNVEDIVDGVKNGRITKADLQRCAKHILGIALKTI